MFLHHLNEHNDVIPKSDNKVGERYLMSIDNEHTSTGRHKPTSGIPSAANDATLSLDPAAQ